MKLYRKPAPPIGGTWFFLENKRFIIVLREVLGDQGMNTFHNHRRSLYTLLLKGSYVEQRLGEEQPRRLRSFNINRLPSTAFHRVEWVKPGTWTIGVMGRELDEDQWQFIVEGQSRTAREHFRQIGARS